MQHTVKSRVGVPTPVPKPTISYWIKAFPDATKPIMARPTPSPSGQPKPSLPQATDVVIIGGGIAGVSTAYHLRKTRPDLQVVLMEARQLSHGATGRNGGLLWPALNAPWVKTADRYGATEASRMMAFELQCLSELTQFIKANGLEEEVRHAPFGDGGFYVYETEQEMQAELAELELMQQFGIHTDVEPLSHRETSTLFGTDAFVGAVRQPGVSRVWAARLVHALARMAAAAGPTEGLVVAENTRVAAVTPLSYDDGVGHVRQHQLQGLPAMEEVVPSINISPLWPPAESADRTSYSEALDKASAPLLQVTTETGESLLARRVVHCTNAYGSSLLPELRDALVPVRNHVAATHVPGAAAAAPTPAFPMDAAFFARGGYVYWSRREDGRMVVGGFRDVVPDLEWGVYDDASLHERIRQELHAYLPKRFPGVFGGGLNPEVEWSGILGFTRDRFPFVGPMPGRRGQFVAAGFSGHGMTRTFTCGRVLADMVSGLPYDTNFPATWLPAAERFEPAAPTVLGPEAAAD
ncbi:hypothetical protein Vafri_19293 [Volvox africanus]|uniref:FAD dependent oxidoreductase domain-containing protein n=1 Tax=Volvox africanus TaxID=51714 RepID=A0A8J4FBY9_9CHLO|nr:hypothetical protein Vafri_19293 [Volvox africanus]